MLVLSVDIKQGASTDGSYGVTGVTGQCNIVFEAALNFFMHQSMSSCPHYSSVLHLL